MLSIFLQNRAGFITKKQSHLHAGRIALLYGGDRPILTTLFRGGSFCKWMEALHKKIKVSELSRDELRDIYVYIAGFAREYRAVLIAKLEADDLRAVDISGDHKFFEGGLALKQKIWTYRVGS